jgi:protease-4
MAIFNIFKSNETKDILEKKKALWDLRSSRVKAFMFILALIFEVALLIFFAKEYNLIGEPIPKGKKVAVINFNEQVTQKYVNKVIKSMDKIKNNKEYSEVLFIMNSPGGSPAASEELSEYLKNYKKYKDITMYVQEIAASGGYYIASAIKPLIANKNAIVGSIGVIMPHYNIGKLADKIGVEEDDISSGKYKKPISLFSKVSDENRAYLKKQLLTPTYNNFINSVAKNRGISREKLLPFTEGKIYIANNKEIKGILVDKISVLYKVKDNIKKRVGKKVSFVDILPKDKVGFLKDKIEFNFSLNTKFNNGLK